MNRKPRRYLRARGALQTVVDLVLQQIGGLVEQVDRCQAIGKTANHLVAAAADWGQLAEIVEQRKCVNGGQCVPLTGQE
jgi:hypothetical protein